MMTLNQMISCGPVNVQYIVFEELVREGLGINAIKFKVPTETSSRKKNTSLNILNASLFQIHQTMKVD